MSLWSKNCFSYLSKTKCQTWAGSSFSNEEINCFLICCIWYWLKYLWILRLLVKASLQGVTSRLLLISLHLTDQTKYRLKAQYVGLKGLYRQKWVMILRIIFSLVYNHLKLWIIVFSLIKNEMFISTEVESRQWPFTVLQQKKKILWGQKSSFPTGDHYQDTSVKLLTPQMANKVSYDSFYD